MTSEVARIISEGILKLDGGSIFGATPKAVWENSATADRKNRGANGGGGSQDNNRDEAEG